MDKKMKVNPYEVSGKIDYDRLIKEFGLSKIDKNLLQRIKNHTKELHFMLKRGIVFAHRDLRWVLDEFEKGNKFFLYTGCGPSGPIHLGHLQMWTFTKWLQDKFNVELWFQFSDDEKFLYRQDKSYDEIQHWTKENMADVIAMGFDPKKTHFLVDTIHAGILYKEAIKFAKKITFSTIKAAFGFTDSNNIGSIFYTSMQAVPSILPSIIKKKNIPCLIPLGVDQDPHFRVARDVYPKLGFYKPAIMHKIMFPPLTRMEGAMSSSKGATINLTDTPNEVKNKINKYAFSGGKDTVEEHRKEGGNPNIDVSFQYLKAFFEPDDEKLKKIHDNYKSGKLLSKEIKQILIKKINSYLKEHQKRRKNAHKFITDFLYKSG